MRTVTVVHIDSRMQSLRPWVGSSLLSATALVFDSDDRDSSGASLSTTTSGDFRSRVRSRRFVGGRAADSIFEVSSSSRPLR